MIALLGALREEVRDLRRQMSLVEVPAEPTCYVYRGEYRGKDVLLAQTGVGRQRAETATEFVLRRYSVTALVSLGFAGALTAQLRVGDMVVCPTLHCATGPTQEADRFTSYRSDEHLLRLATQALEDTALRFCIGSGVTVPQLASSSEKKRELGGAFQAHIVDMESYWIARIASGKQIPFVAVRAISDAACEALPPFDEMLTPDGGWRWGKAISHFLGHPQHLTALPGLSRNVRAARRNLTVFAECLVPHL
jgi:5'-methylthioadenosine/S-adenosylhomocysteine nucleosidase